MKAAVILVYLYLLLRNSFRKPMANVSRSYSKNNSGTVFLRHGVYSNDVLPCTVLLMRVIRSEKAYSVRAICSLLNRPER